ncbi:serine hydrolase domain-containing protein [Nocardioides sp. C4-1]|uniref:serine hydrolase domain-containing protein n=1 Tax=Nocardioides sp. C4-1 TaxID=3151851 RepID=UPI0032633665
MTVSLAGLDAVVAESGFSGVVTVDVGEQRVLEHASGWAHRAHRVPTTPATAFGTASGAKGFTALTVTGLVEAGVLALDQPVRAVLGDDLPLVDDAVTIEHLLAHTSGIGDYLDEDDDVDLDDHLMTAPTHTLTTSEAYLPMLEGLPQKFAPGERFSYCNSGYVVLAIVVERVTGEAFPDVVRRLVLDPAEMRDSGYHRMDELPAGVATGYLHATGDRVNTLHLPVWGSGDGGAFTTATDLHRFWRALFAGRIVSPSSVELVVGHRTEVPGSAWGYGLGFWRHPSQDAVALMGSDAGVSFRTTHVPGSALTATVLGNTTRGAWPVVRLVSEALPSWVAQTG